MSGQGEFGDEQEMKLQNEGQETEDKISPGDLYKKLKNEMNTFKRTASVVPVQEHDQGGSATVTPNAKEQHESKFNIPDWFLTQNESKL